MPHLASGYFVHPSSRMLLSNFLSGHIFVSVTLLHQKNSVIKAIMLCKKSRKPCITTDCKGFPTNNQYVIAFIRLVYGGKIRKSGDDRSHFYEFFVLWNIAHGFILFRATSGTARRFPNEKERWFCCLYESGIEYTKGVPLTWLCCRSDNTIHHRLSFVVGPTTLSNLKRATFQLFRLFGVLIIL